MIYFEGSSFELNSSAVINGKFTFYNVEPLVIIHCKTCMLFCNTAVGKEIPYAFLADPQSVSFLCKTSVNKYEGFAVIFYKIIYTGIKLTISNKEPFTVIFYKLCNLCADSSLCQEIPLITNKIQTRSVLAENTVCYNVLAAVEVNDSGIVLIELAVYIVTIYTVYIFVQACVANCGICCFAVIGKSNLFCKSLVAFFICSYQSDVSGCYYLVGNNIFGFLCNRFNS